VLPVPPGMTGCSSNSTRCLAPERCALNLAARPAQQVGDLPGSTDFELYVKADCPTLHCLVPPNCILYYRQPNPVFL